MAITLANNEDQFDETTRHQHAVDILGTFAKIVTADDANQTIKN
ncbi:hypothetical protein [Chengkuizengella sediminis]|nr:hypothetical protein [Chengkuizengella sediminis]